MPNFPPESEERYSSLHGQKRKPRYARIPWEVGVDRRLSAHDVRVYFVISSSVFQGRTCTIGNQRIADVAAMTARQVRLSVKNLVECQHLQMAERRRGERAVYILTSPLFGQKQGKVDEVISAPSGKRLVSVRRTA